MRASQLAGSPLHRQEARATSSAIRGSPFPPSSGHRKCSITSPTYRPACTHHLLDHQSTAEQTISLKVIAEIEHRISTALDTYRTPTLSVHIPSISTLFPFNFAHTIRARFRSCFLFLQTRLLILLTNGPIEAFFHLLPSGMNTFLAKALGPGLRLLGDRKSTRLNSSHLRLSRMPSSA